MEQDWSRQCTVCGASPVEASTGLCEACRFEEMDSPDHGSTTDSR